MIPGLDEYDREPPKFLVGVNVFRHRRGIEVIERHEPLHCSVIVGYQVLEQEEVRIPAEVVEQRKEIGVTI